MLLFASILEHISFSYGRFKASASRCSLRFLQEGPYTASPHIQHGTVCFYLVEAAPTQQVTPRGNNKDGEPCGYKYVLSDMWKMRLI